MKTSFSPLLMAGAAPIDAPVFDSPDVVKEKRKHIVEIIRMIKDMDKDKQPDKAIITAITEYMNKNDITEKHLNLCSKDLADENGKFGTTVLWQATRLGRLDLMNNLIENGADVNIPDNVSWSAQSIQTLNIFCSKDKHR